MRYAQEIAVKIAEIIQYEIIDGVKFDGEENIIHSRLIAGKDNSNNVWIVAHCYITPYQTILYGFM